MGDENEFPPLPPDDMTPPPPPPRNFGVPPPPPRQYNNNNDNNYSSSSSYGGYYNQGQDETDGFPSAGYGGSSGRGGGGGGGGGGYGAPSPYISKAARAAAASSSFSSSSSSFSAGGDDQVHSYPHNQYAGPDFNEEPQYVRPDYKLHPALRTEDTNYRPYKRKATTATTDDTTASSADDDIRPNLAYQQYPQQQQQRHNPSKVNFPSSSGSSSQRRHLPTREETYEKIGPQAASAPTPFAHSDSSGVVGVAPYKRKTFTIEESREKAKNAKQNSTSGAAVMNSVVDSIREKLAAGRKISSRQAKILDRDQDIIDSITLPTYVAHRTGSGLTPEEVRKAQEEHTRKLLGWKYHVASKASKEQALAKRQKK